MSYKQNVASGSISYFKKEIEDLQTSIESGKLNEIPDYEKIAELQKQIIKNEEELEKWEQRKFALTKKIAEFSSIEEGKRILTRKAYDLKDKLTELKVEQDIAETQKEKDKIQEKILKTQTQLLEVEREISKQAQHQQDAYEAVTESRLAILQNRAATKKQEYEDAQAKAIEEIVSRTAKTFQKFVKAQEEYEKAQKIRR